MVAQLLRLKVQLLRNSLKRSTWQLVGLILAGLYGLSILGLLLVALAVAGSTFEPDILATAVVLAGSVLILGWLIVPVLASGLDMTLDPARFTTFAIPMKSMLTGLALSSFIGVPGAITLLAAVGTAAAWWRSPAAAAAAVICGALGALTCIVASRAITAASTSLASSRRFKDVSGIVLLIPLVMLGPIISGLRDGFENFAEYLPQLAATLSWTPLGAIWSVPADIALGQWGSAFLKFLIALGTLAVLVWLWKVFLARALVSPPYAGGAKRTAGKMGFFAWFPQTPTGAVAARCLTYWFRDPRYSAGLVIAPLLPVIMVFGASQAGGLEAMGAIIGYAGAVATFLVVWSISSDISYDNTAFALHIATGVSGRADRAGRAIAAGVLGLPLGILFAAVAFILNGDGAALLDVLGLVFCTAGAGLGLASVFSAWFTMNVPLPGESPMKSKPGNNFGTVLTQLAGFAGAALLTAPAAVLVLVSIFSDNAALSVVTLIVGIVLGAVYLVVGIRMGGAAYERRAPDLLLAVSVDR